MKKDPCSAAGCAGVVYSRDWCQRHYNRWYRAQQAKAQTARRRGANGHFVAEEKPLPPLDPTDHVPDPRWQLLAACRNQDFTGGSMESFSAGVHRITARGQELLATCEKCPVLKDCYAWMMEEHKHRLIPGVLAGTLPSQRYGIARDLDRELSKLAQDEEE